MTPDPLATLSTERAKLATAHDSLSELAALYAEPPAELTETLAHLDDALAWLDDTIAVIEAEPPWLDEDGVIVWPELPDPPTPVYESLHLTTGNETRVGPATVTLNATVDHMGAYDALDVWFTLREAPDE